MGRARRRIDVLIILASLNSSLELTQYWEQYETNSLGFEVPGREAATTFEGPSCNPVIFDFCVLIWNLAHWLE